VLQGQGRKIRDSQQGEEEKKKERVSKKTEQNQEVTGRGKKGVIGERSPASQITFELGQRRLNTCDIGWETEGRRTRMRWKGQLIGKIPILFLMKRSSNVKKKRVEGVLEGRRVKEGHHGTIDNFFRFKGGITKILGKVRGTLSSHSGSTTPRSGVKGCQKRGKTILS